MKNCLVFLFLLLLTISFSKAQKSIEFKTTKTNAQKKAVKTMLIAGIGKTPARVLLDNLGDELSTDLKARNIQAEYKFFGPDVTTATDVIKRYSNEQKHNAVLIINQSDTSVATRINPLKYASVPTIGTTPEIPVIYSLLSGKSKLLFDQQFDFQLFDRNASSSFWNAELNIYSELSKRSLYSEISEKIIRSLQDNRLFW